MFRTIPKELLPIAQKHWPDFLMGAALDLLGMSLQSITTLGPFYEHHGQTAWFKLEPYLRANPAHLFAKPPAAKIRQLNRREETPHFTVYDGAFESPYTPYGAEYAPYFYAMPENQNVTVRVFEPKGKAPKLGILFLHGWSMSSFAEIMSLKPWELVGDAPVRLVLMSFPFHMHRQPRHAQFSGEFFMSGDLPRSIEAAAQAVCDVRAMVQWMKQQSPTGLLGGSLGGYVGSLTVTQSDDPDFAVLLMAPPDLSILISNPLMGHHAKKGLAQGGYTLDDARRMGGLMSALSYPCQLSPERILIMSGVADQFIHPENAIALAKHFNNPRLVWYPGGHGGVFLDVNRRLVAKETKAMLIRLGYQVA